MTLLPTTPSHIILAIYPSHYPIFHKPFSIETHAHARQTQLQTSRPYVFTKPTFHKPTLYILTIWLDNYPKNLPPGESPLHCSPFVMTTTFQLTSLPQASPFPKSYNNYQSADASDYHPAIIHAFPYSACKPYLNW